jgi:uncharacterized protein
VIRAYFQFLADPVTLISQQFILITQKIDNFAITSNEMKDSKEILDLIKFTVRKYIPDAEVNLFGSRARNNAGTDSDYDILVVTENELTPKAKLPLKTAIRKDLLELDIRSDILIQSRREINMKKKLPGHIIRNILKETVLL